MIRTGCGFFLWGFEAVVSRGSGNKTIEAVRLNFLLVGTYECRESLIFWNLESENNATLL